MTLQDIIARFGALGIYEQRRRSDDYTELVFYNKDRDEWLRIFSEILGPAVKPAGTKPTSEDLRLTKAYGGIMKDQILFQKKFDNGTVVAMFWPWQDNTHTTLKVILLATG